MEILYAPKFVRQYKKLSKEIRALAEKREGLFRKNPFDSRLRTHKLSGVLEGFYSFSVNFSYRITFKFTSGDTVSFYQIGEHAIYD